MSGSGSPPVLLLVVYTPDSALQEQICVSLDRCHRCAQFVSHDRHEFVLGLRDFLLAGHVSENDHRTGEMLPLVKHGHKRSLHRLALLAQHDGDQ